VNRISERLADAGRRARYVSVPPLFKLIALIALGLAPFIFFAASQEDETPGEVEEEPTQPIGNLRIPLAFPFGTPEPSPVPTPTDDPAITTTTAARPAAVQCADGRDNDLDGRVDMADSGCSSRRDTSEAGASRTTTRPTAPRTTTAPPATTQPPTTAPPPTTALAAAPTTQAPTTQPAPTTTRRQVQGECSDGIDNDRDGKTDLEDRASCHGDPTDDE
jgi:cytoskeletal protein RodZ